jgi:hypothetical protein
VWQRLRTVVLESAAQEAADLYAGQFTRFQEAFDALQWLLARKDGLGFKQERGTRTFWVYVQAGDDLANSPDIWAVYETDDKEVVIHEIRAQTVTQNPEG